MPTMDPPLPVGWFDLHVTVELESPLALPTKEMADLTLVAWDEAMGSHWLNHTIQHVVWEGRDYYDVKATYLGGVELLRPQMATVHEDVKHLGEPE